MSDRKYLIERNGRYSFTRRLPTGKYHTVSLKTKSLKAAQKKRDAILAKWIDTIGGVELLKHVMVLRKNYQEELNVDGKEILRDQYQEIAEDRAYQQGVYGVIQATEQIEDLTDQEREPLDFYKTSIGALNPFKVVLPAWLDTIENKSTRADYKKALERLSSRFATAEEINSHQIAGSYLKQASRLFNLSQATVHKDQTAFVHLWKYLGLEFSIWKNQSIPKTPDKTVRREYWENSEVMALLNAAKGSNTKPWLYHVINIAAHTGARQTAITECIYLPEKNSVWFPAKKKETYNRNIPVHPNIKGSLAYWMENKKKSSSIKMAFGSLKNAVGFTNPSKVFHSFRNSFIQQLIFNGVPEGIVSTAVGHKINTMTHGRYGGGQALVRSLEQAIPLVDYTRADWERVLSTETPALRK